VTPADWTELLKNGGLTTPFVIFIIGLMRGWWVMGTQHRQMQDSLQERIKDVGEERDRYRDLALGGLEIGQQTAEHLRRERGRR